MHLHFLPRIFWHFEHLNPFLVEEDEAAVVDCCDGCAVGNGEDPSGGIDVQSVELDIDGEDEDCGASVEGTSTHLLLLGRSNALTDVDVVMVKLQILNVAESVLNMPHEAKMQWEVCACYTGLLFYNGSMKPVVFKYDWSRTLGLIFLIRRKWSHTTSG